MTTIQELDLLVVAADQDNISPEDLLVMQRQIAGFMYRLSEEKAQAIRDAALAERERKYMIVRTKLSDMALDPKLSSIKAEERAESSPAIKELREKEIDAQMLADVIQSKYYAAKEMLNSIQYRITAFRDERRLTASTQNP